MKLSTIANILGTSLRGNDREVKSISIDTRTLKPDALYFAIKGAQFDGHDFVDQALKAGAVAAVVSRQVDATLPALVVEDVHQALIALAQYYRQQSQAKVAAITGSCGKTTTRALLANILSLHAKTLFSEQSFNNDIGVPLTLLRLAPEHQFAVFELGANHPGEIAKLTHLVHPDVAVITNAGPAHLEGFGSLEGVACAKGEIYQGLSKEGIAVINHDDHFYNFWKKLAGPHQIITFGLNPKSDVSARELQEKQGHYQFRLEVPHRDALVTLQLVGHHNVLNALAAAAAAHALGIDLDIIKRGLESSNAEQKRLVIKKGFNDAQIIDDSYNANPLSVTAAIDVLAHHNGEKILVLGDMLELGDRAEDWHRTLGTTAAEKGIDRLFCFGPLSQNTAESFGKGAECFDEHEKLTSALKKILHANATVLIKGSKAMRMGLVVESLLHADTKKK